MANDLVSLTFLHPRGPKEFGADVGPDTTGDQALQGLVDAGFIELDAAKPYALQLVRSGATLVRGRSLVSQGARDGDRVQVSQPQQGGAPALRTRLALDYRAMQGLRGPMVQQVRAYADSLARSRREQISHASGEGGGATEYEVDVERPMLSAPDVPLTRATLLFEITPALAHGYPLGQPNVVVISRPLPFAHRVYTPSGVVCVGAAWRDARGQILLAHLVVQVLRWLGFDEPPNNHMGANTAAAAYWHTHLGTQPLPCSVPYPVLPDDVTHGRPTSPAVLFRPRARVEVGALAVFRPSAGVRP